MKNNIIELFSSLNKKKQIAGGRRRIYPVFSVTWFFLPGKPCKASLEF